MKNNNIKYDLLNNRDWLYQKYINEKLSTIEIGKLCNCTDVTIGNRLRDFCIETRTTTNPLIKTELLYNKRWLYQKYVIEKLSTIQIANICNTTDGTVGKKLKEFNIKTRKISESKSVNARHNFLNNREFLYKKYVVEGLSLKQISNFCNCGINTLVRKFEKFGIKRRDQNKEHNHNWKGGISFEPYCFRFNDDIKEQTRDKFNRVCFLCNKTENKNDKSLSVHHVDYNKGQGCGHGWTLIPLCSSCHAKTNFNRYFWFNLLQNYWLYHQPDKEILKCFMTESFI